MKINPEALRRTTGLSRMRIEETLKLATDIAEDARKEARLASQKCKACFYFPSLAGQAFTKQPCGICGQDQQYSSTRTSALCKPCGAANRLCRHCGGDIEMDVTRREWPTGMPTP
jgi:hypothetical protein